MALSDMSEQVIDPGERAVRFINRLTHTKNFSGQYFNLRPWQEKFIRDFFGTVKDNGTRQYERAFLGIPRKHGKTELIAAIVVYMLFGEGIKKRNLDIFSASGDRQMAGLIHKAALSMINANPILAKRVKARDSNQFKSIVVPSLNNTFKALSADGYKSHGLNPSCVLIDEAHVLKDTRLIDALTTGSNTRDERTFITITTAGDDINSWAYDEWQRALAVQNGEIEDAEFYPMIFAALPTDDPWDEATWFKAMPALGDFVSLDKMRKDAALFKQTPGGARRFKIYYLNMWLPDNSETWLEYETWKACARNINWNDYKGKKAIAGLDCSKVRDLTSFVIVFKNDDGTYTIQPHFWIPGESARARELTDRVPWTKWNSAGHCKFSNKPITDMAIIKRDIEELCALYDIEQVAYDQAGVIMEAHDLYNNSNVPMTQYSQTDLAIGPPSKFFESLVLDGRLIHDDNPVMNLCLMNTTIETNKFSNIRPRRIRNKACIDGVMATIFALGLYCNDLMGADTSIQPGIYYAE